MNKVRNMIFIIILLILVQIPYIYFWPRVEEKTLHTQVMSWSRSSISGRQNVSGYVSSWRVEHIIDIKMIYVWVGNPLSILWEGDVYVTLNNQGDFSSPDQVIVHYQFDKHSESPVPHQFVYYLDPGFRVEAGETIYVWRLFNNISNKSTESGDGQVIIYYTI